MKRHQIIIILFLVFSFKKTEGQILNNTKADNGLTEIDLSSSQTMGYEFLGMGAASIIYSGTGISSTKLPDVGYAGGGVMAITGAMFLIFGEKESGINYWRGMDGIRPDYYDDSNAVINDKNTLISESGLIEYYLSQKRIKK